MASKKPSQKSVDAFTDWHWGLTPAEVIDVDDPDLPAELIECGRLAEIRVRIPTSAVKGNPNRRKDVQITLSQEDSQKSYLTYDPTHAHERLYAVLPKNVQKQMKAKYYTTNPFAEQSLNVIARHTGGPHGSGNDYPNIQVKPIGICTAVVYATEKEGDGFSFYIHRLGEETGVRPCLCIDAQGRLWFAGGAYTSPTAGITN